jgi:hypothetical protein
MGTSGPGDRRAGWNASAAQSELIQDPSPQGLKSFKNNLKKLKNLIDHTVIIEVFYRVKNE